MRSEEYEKNEKFMFNLEDFHEKCEIYISSVDSLLLSMDGKKWSTSLKPDDTDNYPSYENNENEFLKDEGEGLKPISSVGVFNKEASKLELFEKGSLTATDGGYRLLASEVTNTADKEEDGYVAYCRRTNFYFTSCYGN